MADEPAMAADGFQVSGRREHLLEYSIVEKNRGLKVHVNVLVVIISTYHTHNG